MDLFPQTLGISFNKGDPRDPSNYSRIIIISCHRKLFTSCVNIRLPSYSNLCEIVENVQTGFQQGFSTADHLFVNKNTNMI